ncbi:hypothetical protein LUZ60_016950 [Juncus effusus]|nr:hypothetical protein LUZ60_016950 [Juncus effusus]
MQTFGVSVEGPLSLPCCSYSAAYGGVGGGIRSPAVECKLLFASETRRTSFSSAKCNFARWSRAGFSQTNRNRRATKCWATEKPNNDNEQPLAPVQLESPTGQLLLQIMRSHPHLLPATVDQQLDRLQSEKDEQKEEAATRSPQDLLFRRISEVKDKERQKALEEILYCLIIQKFADKNISLIPKISAEMDSYSNQESKLTSIHSSDAIEMIQSHISIILGERSVGPLSTAVQISKLKLGKLYAASVMYGYFLKRVDERYQLERSMKTLPDVKKLPKMFDNMKPNPFWDLESMVQITDDDDEYNSNYGQEEEGYKLRSYVMYLDAETLQRYATMRSKEAVGIIEKQTQALFGRPDIVIADDGSLNAVDDEILTVTFQGLTMLVLEAVAFGSFLWEAEGYVESKYRFINV